jgi:hypothetical protein
MHGGRCTVNPEDGDSMTLQNVGNTAHFHMAPSQKTGLTLPLNCCESPKSAVIKFLRQPDTFRNSTIQTKQQPFPSKNKK